MAFALIADYEFWNILEWINQDIKDMRYEKIMR